MTEFNRGASVSYDTAESPPEGGDADDIDFVTKVLERYRSSRAHSQDWRDEAEKCFGYVAGDQWSDEERADLENQLRPDTVFNRTEVFVSAVCGLEALNRNEVQYIPRKVGDIPASGAADLLNAAAQYVNDDCEGEVAHSSGFKDAVICGMGWTETRMEYEENPDGTLRETREIPGGRGVSLFQSAQNLMLAARAHGLGSLFTTFFFLKSDEIKEILGLPPRIFMECAVFLGASDEKLGPPKRLPITAVSHSNRWGEPYRPSGDHA